VSGAVEFDGASDRRQDLTQHKRLTRYYDRAEAGNVTLTGEVDLAACRGRFVLALGFGPDSDESGHRARAGLLDDFDGVSREYVRGWRGSWSGERLILVLLDRVVLVGHGVFLGRT
jgi:glucoamylase